MEESRKSSIWLAVTFSILAIVILAMMCGPVLMSGVLKRGSDHASKTIYMLTLVSDSTGKILDVQYTNFDSNEQAIDALNWGYFIAPKIAGTHTSTYLISVDRKLNDRWVGGLDGILNTIEHPEQYAKYVSIRRLDRQALEELTDSDKAVPETPKDSTRHWDFTGQDPHSAEYKF